MKKKKELYYNVLEADYISSNIKKRNPFVDLIAPNYIAVFLRLLRKVEYYEKICGNGSLVNLLKRGYLYVLKLKLRKAQLKLGYSIPPHCFKAGLSLPHYGNIIVNPEARIGRNCRIHVGTNIGMHKGKAPMIGDNVYIGPGAIIFGDIVIANNVSIAANATVNKSIYEENVIVAGTPATIIKRNASAWNYD